LAETYARDGLFGKAEFYYNAILRYEKKNTSAIFMLGMLHMGRGDYEQAEARFLETVELDPKFVAAYAELAVLMAIRGDDERVGEYLAKTETRLYRESDRLKKRIVMIKRVQELCCDN
jgi:Flp pilus assembly protein TadD